MTDYALIFWWWVGSLGVYWDDEGWSLYFGPLEFRGGRPPADELQDEPEFDFRGDL